MVSCLILYHYTITSLSKCFLLRAMFHEEDFEIKVLENHTVVMYLWNVKKTAIWQAALTFETAEIMVGYGFGKGKKDAEKEAMKVLFKRIALDEEAQYNAST